MTDTTHNGKSLTDILTAHQAWVIDRRNGERANLRYANLGDADLRDADLRDAYLGDAYLLCLGNMAEIKTLQFDRWMIGYSHDTLQIGCQRHAIEKWRKWDTPAGRKWIASMDDGALEWADKYLAIVLSVIDASPAKATGKEGDTL